MRVVLACKKTAQEFFSQRHGSRWRDALARFDLELEEVQAAHAQHHEAVAELVHAFRQRGLEPEVWVGRTYDPEVVRGADLVVCVGGDGEMLNASRYARRGELVVGIRSTTRSAGQLLLAPSVDAGQLAEAYATGQYHVERWNRIEGSIDDGQRVVTDLALNDIFVGDRYSVGVARYTLRFGDLEERQRSSGLIACTGVGSTGWYANVLVPDDHGGHYGEPFDRCSDTLRFVVRDLIRTPDGARTSAGSVAPGTRLCLKSTMNEDGIVSFDCSKESYEDPRVYPFNRGSQLDIRISDTPLRVLQLEPTCGA